MDKKFLGALLLGALTVTSTGTLVSCKDYDDDITNLQEQIDKNAKAIEEINKLIASGSVITNVSNTTGGVTVTLSNGKTFELKNGEKGDAGKDGIAWTIGDNGYWYKNGEKTEYKAVGQDGKPGADGKPGTNGTNGTDGQDGGYYVPNAKTGCFDYYNGKGEFVKATDISFLAASGETGNSDLLTATKENETITFYNVKGSEGPVVISLNGLLKGLVFKPAIYLDGIETIEYPWLHDTLSVACETVPGYGNEAFTRTRNDVRQTIKLVEVTNYNASGVFAKVDKSSLNWLPDELPNGPQSIPANMVKGFKYGKSIGVEYHMNAANAKVAYGDIAGFNVLEPEVLYLNTRAAAKDLKVTSPENDLAGNKIFNTDKDGILTAGLNIGAPWLLNTRPTSYTDNETEKGKDNVVALQVNNAEGAKVTSDYALLQPTEVYLEGLVWNTNEELYPNRANKSATRSGDELGTVDRNARIHVWDSPKEALLDADGAALQIYYDEPTGLCLKDQLALHVVKQNLKTGKTEVEKLTPAEAAKWGLNFNFELVDYQIDANETRDSRYAKWVDQKTGTVRAWNVKYDGNHADGASATAKGREPLVQVTVTNKYGNVVLDGYILLTISKKHASVIVADQYPTQQAKFDLCNANEVLTTNWSQFNDYVLTQKLGDMTKEAFDELYTADTKDGNLMKQFVSSDYTAAAGKAYGEIRFGEDQLGTTNHILTWNLSESELEELTHDKNLPVELTRYVRFIGKNGAKSDYLYVKLTVELTRAKTGVKMSSKIDNYWFAHKDGAHNGWDNVVFDASEPMNGGNISKWVANVPSTITGNKAWTGTHKYYFVPTTITVKASEGTRDGKEHTYRISPVMANNTVNGSFLFCKYIKTPVADKHAFTTDDTKLEKILNECAIDYTKGAFANKVLYASKDNGTWTEIATLDQTLGEITLIKNDICKEVVNAVGYAEDHKNINTEFNTMLGVVASNGCGVASLVKDEEHSMSSMFYSSFERPVNISVNSDVVVDANTNGNWIYLIDYISMFDWRGPVEGDMMKDANRWHWAFYNVNKFTVHMDECMTTLGNGTWQKLTDVTSKAKFWAVSQNGVNKTMTGDLTYWNWQFDKYNRADKSLALVKHMNDHKEWFGRFFYQNNGANVTEFKVKVPVTVSYEWGDFTKTLELTIKTTLGN